ACVSSMLILFTLCPKALIISSEYSCEASKFRRSVKRINIDDTQAALSLDIANLANGLYHVVLINTTTGHIDREALIVSK
ncbi:MAG: hypothetical protein AAFY41_16280, partial [Bacteroidota bacterium]